MADDPTKGKKKKSPQGGEPSGGTNPDKDGLKGGPFDPTKLSDEDLSKTLEDPRIWKTERLKQLREDSKRLKELKDAESEREKKRLEKQGKFKELQGKTQKELEAANKRADGLELRLKIMNAAAAKGVKDLDAAAKLVNTSKVTKGDDGTYTGIDEAVEALTKERPYLINNQQSVGSPTNPAGGGAGAKKYTITQIQDPKFFQENRDDIMAAQREGRIIEDRPGAVQTQQPPASPPAS